MFSSRHNWVRFSKCFINLQHRRRFCDFIPRNTKQKHSENVNNKSDGNNYSSGSESGKVSDVREVEGYRDLDNLDFMKAAKILFSTPPKKKKFGLDFHLVQLFFALMPSLAVYLVAQYARYEMRKMEAELELKKKAEEEQKAKEMEAAAAEESEAAESADRELLKVKERLESLEDMVKEIVVETKKKPTDDKSKNADLNQEKVDSSSKPDGIHSAAAAKTQSTGAQEATPGQSQKQQQNSEKRG